jgi:hypothetical protein
MKPRCVQNLALLPTVRPAAPVTAVFGASCAQAPELRSVPILADGQGRGWGQERREASDDLLEEDRMALELKGRSA